MVHYETINFVRSFSTHMYNYVNVLMVRFNHLDYSSLPLKLTPAFYKFNPQCDPEGIIAHVSNVALPIDDIDQ